MLCTIYSLVDPNTEEIRYIGKTTQDPVERLRVHIRRAKQGNRLHVCSWILGLLNAGSQPRLVILEVVDGDGSAEEQQWIARGRAEGWHLTNHTNGGEGHLGLSPSPETRAKMRASHQKFASQEGESERRSQRTKASWENPDFRQARINSLRSKIESGEFSESNRRAQINRWARPGERERQSATMKRVANTPEGKARLSKAGKARHAT